MFNLQELQVPRSFPEVQRHPAENNTCKISALIQQTNTDCNYSTCRCQIKQELTTSWTTPTLLPFSPIPPASPSSPVKPGGPGGPSLPMNPGNPWEPRSPGKPGAPCKLTIWISPLQCTEMTYSHCLNSSIKGLVSGDSRILLTLTPFCPAHKHTVELHPLQACPRNTYNIHLTS